VTRVLLVCGSGGVGKTTTSAALALRCAQAGQRTLVLTIDPARRLADALGIADVGNTARRVGLDGLPGMPPDAHLDAMMLDARKTFDDLVARHAPNPQVRDRILANRTYAFVSSRLPGAHEYMAMEKLHELVESRAWDVIVLDTPPSAHALDFLAAPARMANLMDEGVMRWLVLPTTKSGWRMLERGSELLAGVLRNMLGDRTIGDIAEFFAAFQGLWDGFRQRSVAVRELLASPSTTFLLVTTPAPGARAEALDVLEVLRERSLPFAGFLVNRCARPWTFEAPPRFGPRPAGVEAAAWDALLQALYTLPETHRARVGRERAAVDSLLAKAPPGARAWTLWEQAAPPQDLRALCTFAEDLPHLGSPVALRGASV
jgi:anion-transporting  ArsA/GET3 family ATPase